MKILVTGAKGMLGQDMVSELENRYYDVIGRDADDLDITDLRAVRKAMDEIRPDAVVNCAAYTNVDKAESEPETAMRVNSIGPRNLALACRESGSSMLHISTDYVFGGEKDGPWEIWDSPGPRNVYGKSKLYGENFVRTLADRHYIVRTSWLFGRHGRNFVSTMLDLARAGGPLKVVDDQRGCPTFTVDLAKACGDLIETRCFGTYHITNRGVMSWYEFARLIFDTAKVNVDVAPVATEEFPRPARRPKNSELAAFPLVETIGRQMPDVGDAVLRYLGGDACAGIPEGASFKSKS